MCVCVCVCVCACVPYFLQCVRIESNDFIVITASAF